MAKADWAEELADIEFTLFGLRLDWLKLNRDLILRRRPKRGTKYRADQPRLPAGRPDGGQWTDGSGGAGPMSFEQWLAGGWADFDAVDVDRTTGEASSGWKLPDDDAPLDWANGRGRGSGSAWSNASPGQNARWAASELEAQAAIRRVQELDPRWRPPASISEGIEGAILSNQAAVRQAEARLQELQGMGIGSGPFARESIPAPVGRRLREEERGRIDYLGRTFGCHTCGSTEPLTPHGRYIGDHQEPTAMTAPGRAQRLFPHCGRCSARQGGYVQNLLRGR